jgi:dienelactone hydrolase
MRIFSVFLLTLFISLPEVSSAFAPLRTTYSVQTISSKSILQPLPEPTGNFHIGTVIFHLTDKSRPDTLSKKPQQFRELTFQIWYPTNLEPKGATAPYIPHPALLQALKNEPHDSQDPALLDKWKTVRTAATVNASLSRKREKYPLLFLSHALGEPRTLYTALSQELASHGYIVVCIDHPYGGITALPDGTVISTADDPEAGNPEATPKQAEDWAKDASFVLDRMTEPSKTEAAQVGRFAGHIDSQRIGILGHSLGGAAALEACRADSRFKAGADLDGAPFGKVTQEGLKKPTLIMRSGPIYSDEDLARRGRTRAQWEEMGRQGRAMWGSLFQKSKSVMVYSIKINGTGHMSYSDAPFVMPDTITRFGGQIIDAKRGHEIMSHYIRDFFDKYLNGKSSELLDGSQTVYAEVTAERFAP